MTPGDARRLLGGYATGSLTGEERRQLLEAALSDQQLFDALAEEETLRELLSEPAARQRLLKALEPETPVAWFRRPLAWSLAGSLAATLAITAVVWKIALPPLPPPTTAMMKEQPAINEPRPQPEPVHRERVSQARQPRSRPAPPVRADRETKPAESPPVPAARAVTPQEKGMRINVAESEASSRGVAAGVVGGALSSGRLSLLAPADMTRPALRYMIERRGDEGRWVEMPAGLALRPGDRVRLVLAPTADGELQVRERDAEGVWRPLLPPGFRVRAGVPSTVPVTGDLTILNPGDRRLEADFIPDGGSPVRIPISF